MPQHPARVCILLVTIASFAALPSAQSRRTRPAAKPPSKAAAAKPAPAPTVRKEQPVPFHVGEVLTYDVGWSTYLTAGSATITVQQKKPSYSSTAYYIVADGRPASLLAKLYTLYYKVDTLLDVYSLLPQRGSVYAEEGRRHRLKATLFDQAAKKAQYEVQTATVVKKDMAVPAYTQDALSALYVLRSIPLKTGDKFNMPVCDNGTVYKVQMSVGGAETVQTGMGAMQALKVTPLVLDAKGTAPGRGMAIWLSNDARRLPLRIEAQLAVGKFTLILRQVTGA
jgi:hypothetical protein